MKKFVAPEMIELNINETADGRIDAHSELVFLGGVLPHTSYNDSKNAKDDVTPSDDDTNKNS